MNGEDESRRGQGTEHRALIAFFGLTFLFSWSLWLPKVAVATGFSASGFLAPAIAWAATLPEVGAFGPTVAALVLVYAYSGRSGVVRLLGRALDRSFSRLWFVPALVLFPILALTALGVAVVSGVEPTVPWVDEAYVLPIAFVFVLLLGGPLQEEFGWRGYALDPLVERFGALSASLGLGLVWGIWHLPWFYMPSMTLYYQRPLVGFLVTITLLSVVMTWVYANTGGSLAPVILLHASFNWSLWAFPAIESDVGGQAFIALLAGVVLYVLLRHGPTNFSSSGPIPAGGVERL
ncbi:CPBP family intramembrane glutamic endopeptidase [Natronorarus salvus]|uniref:CPBP family intramembrane glutamic endopeptidase n=1 Tax=Natronorarus salvus TaxID=3117733 RepID=UPI002F262C38